MQHTAVHRENGIGNNYNPGSARGSSKVEGSSLLARRDRTVGSGGERWPVCEEKVQVKNAAAVTFYINTMLDPWWTGGLA